MTRLVVVGGGAAGMTAASVAKRRDPDLDVTVLEAGDHVSYSACGIPHWIRGAIEGDADRLVVLSAKRAREKRGLDVRTTTRATSIDATERVVRFEGRDEQGELAYDHLVLAMGGAAHVPFDTAGVAGVYTLRHLDDGIVLKRRLDQTPPQRAAIAGGGFIGVEMADALASRGIPTTLVNRGSTLLNGVLDEQLGRRFTDHVQDAGIDVLLDTTVTGVTRSEHRVTGLVHGEGTTPADLAVLALGVTPRCALAADAGCELDETGTVMVDDHLRTTVRDVWACGDVIRYPHRVTGKPWFLPLALHANRAGRVVGVNVTGGDATFPGILGTRAVTFRGLEAAATGLTVDAARAAGFDAHAESVRGTTRAGYFPDAEDLQVKVVADEGTRRILGAQIVGGEGAGKRIDVLAAAIWMGATTDDVEAMDLAYTPPLGPTWDPVAIGARVVGKHLHR